MREIHNPLNYNKKPKISVIIITLCRPTLYKLINNLLNQKIDYEYEIILIPQNSLKKDLLKDKKIKIYPEPLGKGISYYRNIGIKHCKGNIVAFIDDDEIPINEYWLKNLTQPIIEKKELITTAGTYIPLNQGYVADSISFLGFPGGGYIGFKTMWVVDEKDYTVHLCTGNFAINKNILTKLSGFNENLKFGAEDVDLAGKAVKNKIKIKYIEQATVYHEPRRTLNEFIGWQIRRGKSASEFKGTGNLKNNHIKKRITSSIKILRKAFFTKYFPMVVFLISLQYSLSIYFMFIKK